MGVILDTYNNNTRIHLVKTRITHNGGSKVLSRRKQTNKKNKKKRQKDVWHGSSMKCETRHATLPLDKKTKILVRKPSAGSHGYGITMCKNQNCSVLIRSLRRTLFCTYFSVWLPTSVSNHANLLGRWGSVPRKEYGNKKVTCPR